MDWLRGKDLNLRPLGYEPLSLVRGICGSPDTVERCRETGRVGSSLLSEMVLLCRAYFRSASSLPGAGFSCIFRRHPTLVFDPRVTNEGGTGTISVAAHVLWCANSRNHDGTIARDSKLQNLDRDLSRVTKRCDDATGDLPVLWRSVIENAHPIRRIDEAFIRI